MPSLSELQHRFCAAVIAPDGTAPAFALGDPAVAAERMAIYRRTIRSNYRNALAATYPVVKRIVGAPVLNAAVDVYAQVQPSQSGDLNEYGATFGDLLSRFPPVAALPFLPDVARLEWAIDEAHRARDCAFAPDTVLGALAALPGDRLPGLRLELDPSCRFMASAFPILRIWQVNQADHDGDPHVDFGAGHDRLRIRREPEGIASGGVAIERLGAGDYALLSALQGGALGEAIERAQDAHARFDLRAALHRFIGDGTITGIGDSTTARIDDARLTGIGSRCD